MPSFDFVIKQGDTDPSLSDSLTYTDGSVVNLTGASVNSVMRAQTALTPSINTAATITSASVGQVAYSFTAANTATTGLYAGNWVVTFAGGAQMTFPTIGYLSISVEENLTSAGGQLLVSLPDAKDILNIDAKDHTHDMKLIRFINAVQVIVENIVGPVITRTFEEWADGGQYAIQVRRRPSSALGTTPVLTLMACSEYRGPIEYPLNVIKDPSFGTVYSCMMDNYGTITRRSAGGGIIAFPSMPRSVHYWYQAGQQTVPWNIYEGTLELLREHYQQTQQMSRGRNAAASDDDTPNQAIIGFLVSGKVRQWLAPVRKHPSLG